MTKMRRNETQDVKWRKLCDLLRDLKDELLQIDGLFVIKLKGLLMALPQKMLKSFVNREIFPFPLFICELVEAFWIKFNFWLKKKGSESFSVNLILYFNFFHKKKVFFEVENYEKKKFKFWNLKKKFKSFLNFWAYFQNFNKTAK